MKHAACRQQLRNVNFPSSSTYEFSLSKRLTHSHLAPSNIIITSALSFGQQLIIIIFLSLTFAPNIKLRSFTCGDHASCEDHHACTSQQRLQPCSHHQLCNLTSSILCSRHVINAPPAAHLHRCCCASNNFHFTQSTRPSNMEDAPQIHLHLHTWQARHHHQPHLSHYLLAPNIIKLRRFTCGDLLLHTCLLHRAAASTSTVASSGSSSALQSKSWPLLSALAGRLLPFERNSSRGSAQGFALHSAGKKDPSHHHQPFAPHHMLQAPRRT